MTAPAGKQRDHTLDALKLFAIYLVVWGHAIQYLQSIEYYNQPVYRIIYSFHMPLFMALVGYFAASLTKQSFSAVLAKKARQLLLPAVAFGVLYYNHKTLIWGGVKQWLFDFPGYLFYNFWFLKSAFFCTMLFYAISKLIHGRVWIGVAVSLLISQFVTTFQFNLMYPSFILGVVIHLKDDWFSQHCGSLSFGAGAVFIGMLLFWDSSFWAGLKIIGQGPITVSAIAAYIYKVGYRIVIGLIGTTCFIALFRWLAKRDFWQRCFVRISRYGKETLGVYCLQTYLLEVFLRRHLNFDNLDFVTFNFVVTPLISFLVLVVCLSIISFIRRFKLLSFLFLGSRLH